MPTSNVVTVASGTGFSVNVAALNLSTNLALADFIVLKNGVPDLLASYTKASATQVNYTGVSLATATLEFRRVTPTSVITTAQFGTRIRSTDWNDELDRISRRAEEYALNGVGAGSVVSVALPQNDVFGVLWASDIVFPPNRKVVYDKILTLADKASPTFTGVVTLPSVADADSSLKAATTLFVKNNLAPFAPLASPTFSGTPVLPSATTGITQTLTDNTTKLATTAFVAGNAALLAPLASPTFTGTPTLPTGTIATTQALADNTTKVATTAFVSVSNRPVLRVGMVSLSQSFASSVSSTILWDTVIQDTASGYSTITGLYTVPTGMGGLYQLNVAASISGGAGGAQILITNLILNGATSKRVQDIRATSDSLLGAYGATTILLAAGNTLGVQLLQINSTAASRLIQLGAIVTYLDLYRLNT